VLELPWVAAVGPVGLFTAALVGGEARLSVRNMNAFALLALVAALLTAAAVAILGSLVTPTIGANGIGLSLQVDALNATLLVLVAFVGAVVIRYSRNYMAGAPREAAFTRWLGFTLASVLALIVSGNLAALAVFWALTSYGLGKLLVHYPDRPAAILASRKKWIASRIGDLCMIGALLLAWQQFHTLDIAAIKAAAPAAGHAVAGIALCLAGAAVLKSAQFPLHGWLTEVMETPTPVSALLHAGIINAGGFLVLRFAPVIVQLPEALALLMVVGGVTALFGSVVMLAQTSIKVQLAFSTIAQMGFMILQCGLGAFSSALLHIVAHSLYKAHAFLSSGSVMDLARASWSPSPSGKPHSARVLVVVLALVGVLAAAGMGLGFDPAAQPGVFALGAVVMMGIAHLIANAIDERPSLYIVVRSVMLSALVAGAYFGLQIAVTRLLGSSVPAAAPASMAQLVIAGVVVIAFGLVTVLQNVASTGQSEPRWAALHVHTLNGFYVNTIANRLVLKLWPTGPAQITAEHLNPLARKA
jgi:NAD(P)H-quinone oxidoreductase subunit 5